MGLSQRMAKLEKRQKKNGDTFRDVIRMIDKGLFYDEITEEEQTRYCLYRYNQDYLPDKYFSELMGIEFDLHFQLERKPPPITDEEYRQNLLEVQEIVNQWVEEYNSPEEKKKREEEYRRMREQSEKNRCEFYEKIGQKP